MDSHEDDILGGENNSPNIKNLADEQERVERAEAEQREAAKKAKETVAIDGIAFHEDEIDYHSKNIKQKDSKDLFTNVEDAERNRREAEHKALKYAVTKKEAKERFERDLKRTDEERMRAEAETKKQAEELAKAAEKERQKLEAERREREESKIKAEKKRVADEEKKAKSEQRRSISKKRQAAIKHALFGGWRKFVVLGILLIAIVIGGVFAVKKYIIEPAEEAHRVATTATNAYFGTDYEKEFEKIQETIREKLENGATQEEINEYLNVEKDRVEDPDLKVMVYAQYYFNVAFVTKDYDKSIDDMLALLDKSDKSFVKEYIYRRASQLCGPAGEYDRRDYFAQKSEEYR